MAEPSPFAPPACPYCAAVITAHQQFQPGHCGFPPCMIAHIEAGQAKLRDQRADEYADRQATVRAQASDALARAADMLGTPSDDTPIAVVPYQNEPMAPLPENQRAAFETHLRRAAAAAFAVEDGAEVLFNYEQKRAPEPSIVDAGCAACQGFCCKRGGGDNHAFITRQSLYYIRHQNEDLTEEAMVDHFLDALPDQSVTDACVFQSDTGCTLSRDWRAGLCNTFICHDLYALHEVTGGRLDQPVVIAGINEDEVGSTALYQMDAPFTPL